MRKESRLFFWIRVGFPLGLVVLEAITRVRGSANGLMDTLTRFFALGSVCYFAYYAYDAFRSAYFRTQREFSIAVDDPGLPSRRLSNVMWGLLSLALSVLLFWKWVFRL